MRATIAQGLEGALKYFLLSMLTSLIMAYGLSFLYGLTGTTAYQRHRLPRPVRSACSRGCSSLVGFLAKTTCGAVPLLVA